jgi:hypothetical protein
MARMKQRVGQPKPGTSRIAREESVPEGAVRINGLVLGPLAVTMDLVSTSAQLNGKLLQDALAASAGGIETALKFLDTVQRSYLQVADAFIEFGKVNLQSQLKTAENVHASRSRRGRA